MDNIELIGAVITGVEAVVLLATLIFIYYQYRRTISVMSSQLSIMSEQLSEVRKEIRIATHEDLYEKLLTLYYKYIEYADDLKDVFRAHAKLEASEIRKEYIIFAVLDILYLMYIQRDTLDKGLLKTWEMWINKIFEEPKMFEIYEAVKEEYDTEYIKYIEKHHKKKREDENVRAG